MGLFVYAVVVFFLFPSIAHAWGPGIHLEIALTVLKHAVWAAPVIRNLIQTYPKEFIYGNVSPDILTGKKYAGALFHCHNWSIGKLILEEAKTDMDRAAAWGYLTHLAADTVAHNYFVPYKMIQSYPNRSMGHAYWEMRFDLFVDDDCWQELNTVIHRDYTSFDRLLERVLKKTLFSFSTNKKIFNSILILHRMKQLRFGLRTYAKISQWAITEERHKHYKALMWRAVRDFLKQPEKAACLLADPAGLRKQRYAREMEQGLRAATRTREKTEAHRLAFVREADRALESSLFDPDYLLPRL